MSLLCVCIGGRGLYRGQPQVTGPQVTSTYVVHRMTKTFASGLVPIKRELLRKLSVGIFS
jgi:hypothetical protein